LNSKLLPYFTVIVPTHDRPILLRRAVTSIKAQATTVPFQVIVVGDLVNREISSICDDLLSNSDMYIRRDPCKLADARNAALPFAKGRYVLFLDDDDAWHPNYIEDLYNNPHVQQGNLVYSNCTRVIESRFPEGPQFVSEDFIDMTDRVNELVYVRNQIHMSCIAFPRALLWNLQFDPLLRNFEDWEFLLSVFDRTMPTHIPILGSRIYEVHDETSDRMSNKTFGNFGGVLDYLYVYRRRPAPTDQLKLLRAELLKKVGLDVDSELL
jgi:glycosyltransferase involved in cell wall biosynthesis